jgi:CHAD domain-containing protein
VKNKELKKLAAKYLEDIQVNVSNASSGDEEVIHRLRVGFKKLRALIRLARLEKDADGPSIPRGLKKFYKLAGQLRSLQLYYKHIVGFYKDHTYPENIAKQTAHAHDELMGYIAVYDFPADRDELLSNLPEKLSKDSLKKFINKKAKALGKLPREEIKDAELHTFRKLLKDITYNLEGTSDRTKEFFPIAERKNIRELKKLSDILNNYQDTVVNLSIMDDTVTSNLSERDRTILSGIKKEWEQRKADIRKELLPLR